MSERPVNVGVNGGVGWLALVIAIALASFNYDIRCALGNQPACEAAAEWFTGETKDKERDQDD